MTISRWAGLWLGQPLYYSWSDFDLNEFVFTASITLLLVVLLYLLRGFLSGWKSSKLPPGPWPWPVVGNFPHIVSALPHRTLRALAVKFGGLMYLKLGTQPCIVVSNEAIARELFQTRDALFSSRPQMLFWTASCGGTNVKSFSGAPYSPYWQRLRRLCSKELFSAKRQASYERVRTEEIHDMMKKLLTDSDNGSSSRPLTLNTQLYSLAANNITRMLTHKRYFGVGVNVEDEQGREDYKRLVSGHINMFSKFVISDYVPLLSFVPKWQGIHAEFGAFFKFEHVVTEQMFEVEKHRDRAKQRQEQQRDGDLDSDLIYVPDFVDVLLEALLEDGSPLSDKDIITVLTDMVIGVTETVATTIRWAMAELILHPGAMKQVQEELDTVVGADRLVQEPDIPNLPFLQAFIKEVFRMHPAVPLSLPHQSTHATEFLGFKLPARTYLILNIFAIHRDPSVYESPEVFDPERFVGHSEVDQTSAFDSYALLPFGAGRRMCPGFHLGNLLVALVLAHLLHSFNWSLPEGQSPGNVDMTETFGATMSMKTPLHLVARPKSPAFLY